MVGLLTPVFVVGGKINKYIGGHVLAPFKKGGDKNVRDVRTLLKPITYLL